MYICRNYNIGQPRSTHNYQELLIYLCYYYKILTYHFGESLLALTIFIPKNSTHSYNTYTSYSTLIHKTLLSIYTVGLRPLHKRMYVRKVKNSITIITRVLNDKIRFERRSSVVSLY